MRISFVMLNNHDIISLIENRLDSVSAEYQSVDNKIEIYRLDGDLIILEINQDMFSILYRENKYDFKESDRFLKIAQNLKSLKSKDIMGLNIELSPSILKKIRKKSSNSSIF